jgi:hypothetical protein
MRLRRMIVTLTATASLSLGLPLAAASAAPATHSTAGVPAAAKAAAASTAQTGSPSSSVTGGATPLITWRSCAGQTTTWVDIDVYFFRVAGLFDYCYGFTGTWHFSTSGTLTYTSHFCAGNNRGDVVVKYWPSGTIRTFSFGPGTQIAWPTSNPPVSLVSLTITGWSGSDTCTS